MDGEILVDGSMTTASHAVACGGGCRLGKEKKIKTGVWVKQFHELIVAWGAVIPMSIRPAFHMTERYAIQNETTPLRDPGN